MNELLNGLVSVEAQIVGSTASPECQIASNCDPHFASNNDPLKEQDWGLAALFSGSGGAVGKWPAGVTV